MDGIRIVALPTDVAEEVRRTLLAPGYDHPAHLELAAGYGPCRVCLHTFESGVDKRILFTHDPFAGPEVAAFDVLLGPPAVALRSLVPRRNSPFSRSFVDGCE